MNSTLPEYSVEIEPKTSMYTSIIRYTATFPHIKIYFSNSYTTREIEKYNPLLKIGYGLYQINFENNNIFVEHLIDRNKVKGTSFGISCYKTLKIYSDDLDNIIRFINTAKRYCSRDHDDKVTTKILKDGCWTTLSKLAKRSWDTIYLDGSQLEDIKNDINNFVSEEEEYIKLGIPYKRNYLFFGLPGTGKTSLIFTIASELDMGVGIISLGPSLNDSRLMEAISELDDNYILVLEDVDSLFIKRERRATALSFSGLLNVLDGLGRKHRMITFMTTNFKERLDTALIRPGRIDYQMEFKNATPQQISLMFKNILPAESHKYLNKFLKRVEYYEFTTALLQKFLFENRKSNILDKIDILKNLIKNDDKLDDDIKHIYS